MTALDISAANWYASTNGTPSNVGTLVSPWDLYTVGHKTNIILGGDIVFLRGGSYTNYPHGYVTNTNPGWIFEFLINGDYTNNIVIQPYNNEHVIIDGQAFGGQYGFHSQDDSPNARPTLKVGDPNNATVGHNLTFIGLEILSSSLEPRYANIIQDSSFPPEITRPEGPDVYGRSNIFANCYVHDLTTGISTWGASGGSVLYWNVIGNNGWQSGHRHGHNMYSQNFTNSATKYFGTNWLFNAADKNYQVYGSSAAQDAHYRIIGTVSVNADTLVGGRSDVIVYDQQILSGYYYNSDLVSIFQYGPNYGDIVIAGNYIVSGKLQGGAWASASITNNVIVDTSNGDLVDIITSPVGNVLPWNEDRNTFYTLSLGGNYFRNEGAYVVNFTNWKINTKYDSNSVLYPFLPATNLVVVHKNYFDPNKGGVIVYNHALGTIVVVNISTVLGWNTNEVVLVRNVQDYYADTTISTLSGGNIVLDMTTNSHTIAIPYGTNTAAWGNSTFPNFGEFILEKTVSTSTNTLTLTSTPSTVAVTVTPNDLNGLGSGVTPFNRIYINGSSVTFNANGVVNDKTFQKWTKNGSDYTNTVITSVNINSDFTMSAIYTNNATNTITIQSSIPSSGIVVTNSPADQNGVSQTTTPGVINYFFEDTITLTVPVMSLVTNTFLKWTKNGVDYSGVNSIMFNVGGNDTYKAIYSPPISSGGLTNNTLLISRRRPF